MAALQLGNTQVLTGAGQLSVEQVKRHKDVVYQVNLGSRSQQPLDAASFQAAWLGLENDDISVSGIYSAGKAKFCIRVASLVALNAARFDLPALADWNRERDFSGYVLFAEDQGQWYARATNPLFNLPEDFCLRCLLFICLCRMR